MVVLINEPTRTDLTGTLMKPLVPVCATQTDIQLIQHRWANECKCRQNTLFLELIRCSWKLKKRKPAPGSVCVCVGVGGWEFGKWAARFIFGHVVKQRGQQLNVTHTHTHVYVVMNSHFLIWPNL